ncbi:GDSL esterase/lipase EXL1 isoform X1 [Aegilops tauschii subsp. strangulata]|uniref:GDSL esterase/lipase EXL3 n=2 Tax=Aegilops tauschii subsp. strangulata TaxID=200361 RepID=A0A453S9P9_AEGTS|nr:GDSL esterase/lipase EXL1 isoform X1 [Aegilops tauschii subsp. strangulata]
MPDHALLLVSSMLVVVMAHLSCADGAVGTGKSKISAVFMFGDSIVDPGNNNNRLTEARANFPPYGQDFPGGKATGRFSNGRVPGDMLASKLGVKEFLPPYNGDDLELSDLLTGVAFASGGSGYDPLTSIPATATSSTGQLDLFLEYKEKLITLVGEEEATRVISEGIYFTAMGANDIANNYFSIPLRRHQYDLPSYVNFLISSAVNFTMKLNDIGANRIGFFGIPPIGCCPSQRKHGSRECDTLQNQAAELFNSGIEKEIERLNAERNVHDSRFAYLDIYYNLLELIQQHDFYGFKEVTEGCCGSNVLNAAIFIQYHPACPNAYDYIFWDSFHCTEKAYNIVVDEIFQQNLHYLM